MDVIAAIVVLFVFGLVIGAFARFALPGKDPMSLWQTAAIGVAGSLMAAFVTVPLLGRFPGILLSIVGATAIVYFIRKRRGGGLTDPGTPPAR